MRSKNLPILTCVAALFVAGFAARAQTVIIEFSSVVTNASTLLQGVHIGSVITGRITVDLASLTADGDPWPNVGAYGYGPGDPGFIFEFQTGFETIRYDSIHAATDGGGLAPGIWMYDGIGDDWLIFQERDQGKPYGASLSFERFTEPQNLLTGDYFPESVNLKASLEKAQFFYGQSIFTGVGATVTEASMTVVPGGSIAGLLAFRIQNSDLPAPQKQELIRTLQASEAALAQGQCKQGLHQLRTFQNKVHAQVEPADPVLADRLIVGTQALINAGCDE